MSIVLLTIQPTESVTNVCKFIQNITFSCYRESHTEKKSESCAILQWRPPSSEKDAQSPTSNSSQFMNAPLLVSSLPTSQSLSAPSSTSTLQSQNCSCTILVKSLHASRVAGIALGGEVIDEFKDDKGEVCVLKGPSNIEVILLQDLGDDVSHFETLLAFMHHKLGGPSVHSPQQLSSQSQPKQQENVSLTSPNPKTTKTPGIKKCNKSSWTPSIGVHLPTIVPMMLHKGEYRLITANTPEPIAFENDIFQGVALLLLNTRLEGDIYRSRFEGTKYFYEVQVQGRFKIIPKGRLFIGAEITKKMELGLLTRGLCSSILKLGRAVNAHLHHSFGDDRNFELPHITGPMWSAIDRLNIAPKGQTPPTLGLQVPEDPVSRSVRRKYPDFNVNIELTSTYTLSFKTSNIDLINWKLGNIPLMGPIDLHTFWGDAALRMCAYCVPDDSKDAGMTSGGLRKFHPQKVLQYCFALEVDHISNRHENYNNNNDDTIAIGKIQGVDGMNSSLGLRSRHRVGSGDDDEEEASAMNTLEHVSGDVIKHRARAKSSILSLVSRDENEDMHSNLLASSKSKMSTTKKKRGSRIMGRESQEGGYNEHDVSTSSEDDQDEEVDDDDYDEEEDYFDAEEGYGHYGHNQIIQPLSHTLLPSHTMNKANLSSESSTSSYAISSSTNSSTITTSMPNTSSSSTSTLASSSTSSSSSSSSSLLTPNNNSPSSDYVMAAIEVDEMRKSRQVGRRVLYAFRIDPDSANDNKSNEVKVCSLRTYKEWTAILPVKGESKRPANYSRLNEYEQRRQELNRSYRFLHTTQSTDPNIIQAKAKLQDFLSGGNHCDTFLTKAPAGGVHSKRLRVGLPKFGMEEFVCVQQGNYFWSEEYLALTNEELIFIKQSSRISPVKRLRLPLQQIINVEAICASEAPFAPPCVYMMLISTFSRQYMVMLRGERTRDLWIDALQIYCSRRQARIMSFSSLPSAKYVEHPLDDEIVSQIKDSTSMAREVDEGANEGANSTTRATSLDMRSPLFINETHFSVANGTSTTSISSSHTSPLNRHLDLLARPAGWKLGDRVILNARSFTIGCKALTSERMNPLASMMHSPPLLVQTLLKMVFQLCTSTLSSSSSATSAASSATASSSTTATATATADSEHDADADETAWISFMDGIALLQSVNLGKMDLDSKETLCMFINLYHIMVLHGFLVVGLPKTASKWSGFFNTCSYEAFGDVFSIAELEHNIIRNGMTRPNLGVIASALIPQSRYNFALSVKDYRLLWALNCGSQSMFHKVPIYEASSLEQQLDAVVRVNLELQLTVTEDPPSVTLPALLQGRGKDFIPFADSEALGESKGTGTSTTTKAKLLVLLKHCRHDSEAHLLCLISKKTKIAVQYAPFDFRCTFFSMASDKELFE